MAGMVKTWKEPFAPNLAVASEFLGHLPRGPHFQRIEPMPELKKRLEAHLANWFGPVSWRLYL